MAAKRSRAPEQSSGAYVQLPIAVLRSNAYIGCSHYAKALLIELLGQHNGKNNGHLHLAVRYLAGRGFRSRGQIAKGRDELIARNLVVKTHQGGLPTRKTGGQVEFDGCDLFAVTWLPISDYKDLNEIRPGQYHPGAWHFDTPAPMKTPARKALIDANEARKKTALQKKMQAVPRYATVPPHGTQNGLCVPPHGTVKAEKRELCVPPHGKNVVAIPTAENSAGAATHKQGDAP